MRKLFASFTRECVRPMLYRVFRHGLYALAAVLLAEFFLSEKLNNPRAGGFALCAALFFAGAWGAYLRLDGMNLPRRLHIHTPRRKHPVISYGDMEDHIDDYTKDTSELEPEEENAAIFVSDIILALVFALLSFI